MPKEFSDLEEKEQEKLSSILDNVESIHYKSSSRLPSSFGICSSCSYFKYARTQYRIRKAFCGELEIPLYDSDPITECSEFSRRGELSLWDMKGMAIYLEPDKKEAGFLTGVQDGNKTEQEG